MNVDPTQLAIIILGTVGGGTGLAAVIKAWSDRRTAPRSVAVEESDGALRVLGTTIDRLERQLGDVRKEAASELAAARKEAQVEIGWLRAENVELRAEVKQLRKELHGT